jgi:hypothetical protein
MRPVCAVPARQSDRCLQPSPKLLSVQRLLKVRRFSIDWLILVRKLEVWHGVVMLAILASSASGVLGAILGVVVTWVLTGRSERRQWKRDTQLQASVDLVNALQLLIRRMINMAYLGEESGSYESRDFKDRRPKNEHAVEAISRIDDAQIEWNNAQHKVMVFNPPEVVALIPALDREADRLLNQAHARAWTRSEYREERRTIGRMAADYLKTARRVAGESEIELASIYTWDPMNFFISYPQVRDLLSLNLNVDDFAFIGSAPLLARGWIKASGDIDVVARGSAWTAAGERGKVTELPENSNIRKVSLFDGRVEILDGYVPEICSADKMIDEAEIMCGLRFVRLEIIIQVKQYLARPKDLKHLEVIEEHTGQILLAPDK